MYYKDTKIKLFVNNLIIQFTAYLANANIKIIHTIFTIWKYMSETNKSYTEIHLISDKCNSILILIVYELQRH